MKDVTFQVHGRSCEDCEDRITRALTRIPGVRTTKASHHRNEVKVLFDDARLSSEDVANAIMKAGFRTAGTPSRYAVYGGCGSCSKAFNSGMRGSRLRCLRRTRPSPN